MRTEACVRDELVPAPWAIVPLAGSTVEEKLRLNVAPDGDCRRWTGAHHPSGYGCLSSAGKLRRVHRLAYEAFVGPIPDGHEIDHVAARGCRFRDCIWPDHLEAVTHADNLRRRRPGRYEPPPDGNSARSTADRVIGMSPAERLASRSARTADGCLRWLGAHTPDGYGVIRVDGRQTKVHLAAYVIWVGEVPAGHYVTHDPARTCGRDCIEPTHLEAVTRSESRRRTEARRRRHVR